MFELVGYVNYPTDEPSFFVWFNHVHTSCFDDRLDKI